MVVPMELKRHFRLFDKVLVKMNNEIFMGTVRGITFRGIEVKLSLGACHHIKWINIKENLSSNAPMPRGPYFKEFEQGVEYNRNEFGYWMPVYKK